MVPDKIYIPTEYTDNDITPVGVTLQQVFPNDVCYIRKDALVEWAKDMNECGATLLAVDTLIDKLNEM